MKTMQKQSKSFFLLAACMCSAAFADTGVAPLEIAARGQPAAYTIVIPEKASPVEKYASEELQSFLEQVTGVKLPVASDAAPLPSKAILFRTPEAYEKLDNVVTRRLGLPEKRTRYHNPHITAKDIIADSEEVTTDA